MIEIRGALKSDIAGMIVVWIEFMDYMTDLDSIFRATDEGHIHFKQYVEKTIDDDDHLVLVAREKGIVTAFSISQIKTKSPLLKHKRYGYIGYMAVSSGFRRNSIGESMLKEIQQWVSSRKLERIELNVVANNIMGYAFWKKHGFADYKHALYRNS